MIRCPKCDPLYKKEEDPTEMKGRFNDPDSSFTCQGTANIDPKTGDVIDYVPCGHTFEQKKEVKPR